MGRPIKKEFIGGSNVPVGSNMLAIDSAYIPGASDVSTNVSIVSQKGTGRYIVTDGTNTGLVALVDGSNNYVPVEGEAISKVEAISGSSDVETTVYTPATITLNGAGTGYVSGDVITIPNAGTATVDTVTLSTPSGVITAGTTVLSTNQYSDNNASNDVTSTGGTGTGATFNVETTSTTRYSPATVTLNGAGTGYAVNDTVTIEDVGTITVTAIGTDGAITTITSVLNDASYSTDMAGTAVAQTSTSGSGTGATFDVTSTTVTVYPVSSITLVSGGEGYTDSDVLTVGDSLGTYTVTTVSTETSGGAIETITTSLLTTPVETDMAGTAISGLGGSGTGATFDVTSTSSTAEEPSTVTEYAMKIFNRTVVTYQDHVYEWNLNIPASVVGEANLTTKIKS